MAPESVAPARPAQTNLNPNKHQNSLVRSRTEVTTDLGQYLMPEI
jgi:hypothetical protein